jgi:TonB family protein
VLRHTIAGLLSAGIAAGAGLPAAGLTAELRYLQHSGWLVKTASHVLVFDYVEGIPGGTPLCAAAAVKPEDLDGRSAVVFVSHGHVDHYSPAIAEWARQQPTIRYVVGWPDSHLPEAHVMKPRETWSPGDLVVTTTGSTDEGVGFLVTVDGLTLYHAGDHARWSDESAEAFEAEIRWLESRPSTIDLAFFPIATGAACDPRPSIWQGVRFAALVLKPRVLIPMHIQCLDKLDLYEQFRSEVSAELGATSVVAPTLVGERFHYEGGRLNRVRVATAAASGPAAPAPSPWASATEDYDEPPKIVKRTTPVYPREPFYAGIEGTVEVELVIDQRGLVSRLRVVKSIPALDDAALTCVKQWRFIPAKKAGLPVESIASAPVTFRITKKKP